MSSSPTILTVIAEPALRTPASDLVFVDGVDRALAGQRETTVARASSIAKLNREIQRAVAEHGPRVLQIVGHGAPGQLSLGEFWSGIYADPRGHYVLDSNPGMLNILAKWRGKLAEVILAGCFVGARASRSRAVGGPTLLFTLEELWGCPVHGATGDVQARQFQAGRYTGATCRWSDGAQLAANGPVSRSAARAAPGRRAPRMRFVRATAARGLHHLGALRAPRAIPRSVANQLRAAYAPSSEQVYPGLASRILELEVALVLGRQIHPGTAFLANDGEAMIVELARRAPDELGWAHNDAGRSYCRFAADASKLDALWPKLEKLFA